MSVSSNHRAQWSQARVDGGQQCSGDDVEAPVRVPGDRLGLRMPLQGDQGRQGETGPGEQILQNAQRRIGIVDRFGGDGFWREGDAPGVLEDHDVGVGEHGQAVHPSLGQAQGAGDFVAMRRPAVVGGHLHDRHALCLQVVENLGSLGPDRMDDEIGRIYSRHPAHSGKPAQDFEMEARMVVDDTGDCPTRSRLRWSLSDSVSWCHRASNRTSDNLVDHLLAIRRSSTSGRRSDGS